MLHPLIVLWTGRRSSLAQLQAAQLGVRYQPDTPGETHYNCISRYFGMTSYPLLPTMSNKSLHFAAEFRKHGLTSLDLSYTQM